MKMKNYVVAEESLTLSPLVPEGTQEKHCRNNYFYKVNKMGNEGFTEFLVSEILKRSNWHSENFVSYEYCSINDSLGCRSYSFLPDDLEFITMNKLYSTLTGNPDLGIKLLTLGNAKERLDFILSIVREYGISVEDFSRYLERMMQLDLLILNTDRHVHNYGVLYNPSDGQFCIAPIFDNGRSLDTDHSGGIASRTLSGSFTDQVTAFEFPVKSCLKIDYDSVDTFLQGCIQHYGNLHEITVLKARLKKFEYLFKERVGSSAKEATTF